MPKAEQFSVGVTRKEAIELAIRRLGNGVVGTAAHKLDVKRVTLHRWINQGIVPETSALLLAKETGVPLALLNPDVDLKGLRDLVAPNEAFGDKPVKKARRGAGGRR